MTLPQTFFVRGAGLGGTEVDVYQYARDGTFYLVATSKYTEVPSPTGREGDYPWGVAEDAEYVGTCLIFDEIPEEIRIVERTEIPIAVQSRRHE